jgi:hypothetical protein
MSWKDRQPMYLPGEPITTVQWAVELILAGDYLMFRGKPMHPAVLANWSINQLRSAIRGGWLRETRRNPARLPRESASAPQNDHEFEEVA